MKKIFSILSFSALLALISSGCDKYVEGYDISPNSPQQVGPDVLLSGIQVSTINTYTGNLARLASLLTEQTQGQEGQYLDIEAYILRESDIDNEWKQIYNGGLINSQLLIDQAGDANPYYRGIGRIFKAMNIGMATDLWGDVPYTQALRGLQGEGAFNSAYDDQESILRDIQATLDAAIADLADDNENLSAPGSDDLFFSGDPQKWRNIARVLKARYLNRLSQRDPAGSAQMALAALDAAYADGFDASGDLIAPFGESVSEWNQWYAFEEDRGGYLGQNQFFIDLLADNNDPRADEYFSPGGAGAPVGPYLNGPTNPLPLITYYEAKFIEAEAALRAGDADRAAMAFNEAVAANLGALGISDAAFLASVANETAASITLEKIMTQKYIAMFGQVEVYNDWRRTGFPMLTPNPGGTIPNIPVRFPTAQDERLYNTSAVVNFNLLDPVWWDM